ncbi:MAG: GAF domain-containing protein [Burkholderiales bacterium]|nr:GAF domain-containing protein [Burkholderiales bacterium]
MEDARAAASAPPLPAVDGAVRLHELRRSLSRLGWRLVLLNLSLLLLAVTAGYAALVMDLLPPGSAPLLALCSAAMVLFSSLLCLLLRLTVVREVLAALSAAEAGLRSADAESRRRACLVELTASLQQAQSPAELARQLLSGLARSLPLHQGLCCYWDEGSQSLNAAARYGADGANEAQVLVRQPELGPLLLEVARSRRAITLRQPGARYLRISSGLGDAEPAELLIHPIEHRGRLFGLLELASLQPFGEAAGLLIEEIAPVFAMCLDILQRAERSETLLEQIRVAEAMRQTAPQAGGGTA